jgi:acylphosphatase
LKISPELTEITEEWQRVGSQKKVKVVYSGRVQGVGFRATVRDISEQFEVVGTVCNVSDGSVELVAVGTTDVLLGFLQAIDSRLSRNLENCLLDWLEAETNEFSGFSIIPDKWGG